MQWFYPVLLGMLYGVAAMLLHEGGHIVAALALGVRVKKVGLRWNRGIFTVREMGTPGKNLLIAAAGPLTNMLLVSFWGTHPTFGLANFCYALANLLPIEGSDGSRMVACWLELRRHDRGV